MQVQANKTVITYEFGHIARSWQPSKKAAGKKPSKRKQKQTGVGSEA